MRVVQISSVFTSLVLQRTTKFRQFYFRIFLTDLFCVKNVMIILLNPFFLYILSMQPQKPSWLGQFTRTYKAIKILKIWILLCILIYILVTLKSKLIFFLYNRNNYARVKRVKIHITYSILKQRHLKIEPSSKMRLLLRIVFCLYKLINFQFAYLFCIIKFKIF